MCMRSLYISNKQVKVKKCKGTRDLGGRAVRIDCH